MADLSHSNVKRDTLVAKLPEQFCHFCAIGKNDGIEFLLSAIISNNGDPMIVPYTGRNNKIRDDRTVLGQPGDQLCRFDDPPVIMSHRWQTDIDATLR